MSDIADLRAIFDRLFIDYHVETHEGPHGSPIEGAAVSIEIGRLEFAFDSSGSFMGWVDFDPENGTSVNLHPRLVALRPSHI